MINPVFLKTFVTLCETKSFTRTAHQLAMTQPGVSQHLKWLEDYFQPALVTRKARAFDLTEAGDRLLSYAKHLFAEHEQFKTTLAVDDPFAGPCRFASPGSFGMKMYSFLLELNQQHRDLAIHYTYAPNTTVAKDVLEDRIDVGFVTLEPREPDLVWKEFDREKLCLVLPATARDLTYEGLHQTGFIGHPDGFYYASRVLRENFPKQFRSMTEFPIKGFINQITRILEPVAAGMGFTVLPEYACQSFPKQNRLRYYPLKKNVEEQVYWINKRDRKLPSRFEFIRSEFNRAS